MKSHAKARSREEMKSKTDGSYLDSLRVFAPSRETFSSNPLRAFA